MKTTIFKKFWEWYEKSYKANVYIAVTVFCLQIIHLIWMTNDVVLFRLFGVSQVIHSHLLQQILAVVDYLEIPSIIAVSFIYIRAYREGDKKRALWYLFLLNTQWIHILWITHEYIAELIPIHETSLKAHILIWTAIAIDYLEVPVMIDTIKKARKLGKQAFIEEE